MLHISDLYLKVSLKPTYDEALEKDVLMDASYELDRLLPASASILDIIAASASRTLPKEASAEDMEGVVEVIIVERKLHFCNRC